MKILVVDSTIRSKAVSRTAKLCEHFITKIQGLHPEYEIELLSLKNLSLKPLLVEDIEKRDQLIERQEWENPMFALATQFASADKIIVAAPYWDLCFPSLLKVYLEHIFVCGITFAYEGPKSVGKCRAKELLYLQSSGGFLSDNDPGRVYMQSVCDMFGIDHMTSFCAEGVDIQELDQKQVWESACARLDELATNW